MSCEGNRHKYFQILSSQGADAQALERLYQAAYNRPAGNTAAALQAEAKTRLLFTEMQRLGLHPPTHSPTGLPGGGWRDWLGDLRSLRSSIP